MRKRGLGLAGTLVVCSLLFVAALAVSGAGFFHLSLSSRGSNEAIARNLAESAVSRVIERVLAQEKLTGELDYGEDGAATVEVHFPEAPEGAYGLATFDPGRGQLRCVNNLRSDSATAADNGLVVPRESLYIVGYGVCGGVERRVEAVVSVPRFPYSIACQGSFVGSDLLVAGLEAGTRVQPGVAVPEEDLRPGHLASNSSAGPQAVRLTGTNRLKGNLRSASGADVGANTVIEGELLLHSPAIEIPTINLETYRPDLSDSRVDQGLTSLERDLHLDRTAYFGGEAMTVVNGLTLDGGVLFVDGDLTIEGGISGKGAVIVTGDLSVHGSGSLASDNVAAILAGGFLEVEGTPGGQAKDAVVEGLLYSGKRISANNVTLVGALLSSGDEPSEFHNSVILGNDEHTEVVVRRRVTSPGAMGPVNFQLVSSQAPGFDHTIDLWAFQRHDLAGGSEYQFSGSSARYAVMAVTGRNFQGDEYEQFWNILQQGQFMADAAPPTEFPVPVIVGTNPDGSPRYDVVPGRDARLAIVEQRTDDTTVTTGGQTVEEDEEVWSIDLADFVDPVDRMRVRWWRTL
ncbi:MAG: hypothetical protein AB7S38_25965 [Vulcanimicrobiota bacterium]